MTLPALLDRCHARDVRLWVDGDRLRFDAPAGVLDPELRDELRANKPALIELLSDPKRFAHATVIESDLASSDARFPPVPTWEELAPLRWGSPGLSEDDAHLDEPGITIPGPHRYRVHRPVMTPPRRTPWNTFVVSAPDALPIELFGPTP